MSHKTSVIISIIMSFLYRDGSWEGQNLLGSSHEIFPHLLMDSCVVVQLGYRESHLPQSTTVGSMSQDMDWFPVMKGGGKPSTGTASWFPNTGKTGLSGKYLSKRL